MSSPTEHGHIQQDVMMRIGLLERTVDQLTEISGKMTDFIIHRESTQHRLTQLEKSDTDKETRIDRLEQEAPLLRLAARSVIIAAGAIIAAATALVWNTATTHQTNTPPGIQQQQN